MATFAAQNLLPGEGDDIQFCPVHLHRESGRGGITDGQARAICGDHIGIRQPHARGGAVPGEHHILIEIDGLEIDDLAIGGFFHGGVELELLDHIGDPALAKAFPGQHFHRAGAQEAPQRHFHRAGIRGGDDADAVIRRHIQNFTGEVDGLFQLGLANSGAMRAPKGGISEHIKGEAGDLRAGARRKARICRTRSRGGECHIWYPYR